MENGYFSKRPGKATNKLALMWMKLCDRYATRGNVRGYTYNDEMRGQAILQLAPIGLQFDELKSTILAWYSGSLNHLDSIYLKMQLQNIRDDILRDE